MTEGSDRTLQELIDTMRAAYEQDGKSESWRRSRYDRIFNGILKVYSADLRESQITKDHFDPKQYFRAGDDASPLRGVGGHLSGR